MRVKSRRSHGRGGALVRVATAASAAASAAAAAAASGPYYVLDPQSFAPLLRADLAWAAASIPLFEASDANLTFAYYFRWRSLRSHIHATNASDPGLQWVITEFSPPVPWAGSNNTIPCAAGHQLTDARWLRDPAVAESYTRWWLSGLPNIRRNYYSWLMTAARRRLEVAGAAAAMPGISALLPNATAQFRAFANGSSPGGSAFVASSNCLYNVDGTEGQERAISGAGCKPIANSLMYGEARALAELCGAAGDAGCAAEFGAEAARWRERALGLWNSQLGSFDTLKAVPPNASAPPPPPPPFAGVRELGSLSSPWLFKVVQADNAAAFAQGWAAVFDAEGFLAPHGLRTAERRHPKFNCPTPGCSGGCYWSGPTWPFESSKLLRAAVDVLQDAAVAAQVPQLNRSGLALLLRQFTAMHLPGAWTITNWTKAEPNATADPAALVSEGLVLDGLGLAWIAELGCADDDPPRYTDVPEHGYLYEHSSFVDLVISGVAGLAPAAWSAGAAPPSLRVLPLQPSDEALSWWCLDGALVGGRIVSVLWDLDGSRYGRGRGLSVFLDGVLVAQANSTQGPSLEVLL